MFFAVGLSSYVTSTATRHAEDDQSHPTLGIYQALMLVI